MSSEHLEYVVVVRTWAKGSPESQAFVATTVYGFPSFEEAQAFEPPVSDHLDRDVHIWPLTDPPSPS